MELIFNPLLQEGFQFTKTFGNIVFVKSLADLPAAVAGVITLAADTTYEFCGVGGVVDLLGNRIEMSGVVTLRGGSSETTMLISTGLVGQPLITTEYTLAIQFMTFSAHTVMDIDGQGTAALDWTGVNFLNCENIGTIKNFANFVFTKGAFLNSSNLVFDGTFATVAFNTSLMSGRATGTIISVAATAVITRRFRFIYSAFVALGGTEAINFNALATAPTEGYILDTCSFAGGGTYLVGITHTSNKALFTNCTNITNTAVNGQLYMQGNATATNVLATSTFYKVAGTTTASADNSKFTHSNNRLTCDAVVSRKYLIQFNLSFTSGANNVCEFGFYDSQLAGIRTPSRTLATANASGRAENVSSFCIITMKSGDYLEVHCANNSAASNITVESLNFIISEIK